MTKEIRILAGLPVIGQPRHSKRIEMLMQEGFKVVAAAFERDYHDARIPKCEIEILGTIQHGKYLSRVFKMLRAMPKYRQLIKEHDLIYVYGLDMALLSYFSGIGLAKPIVLEVGDIRKIQVSRNLGGAITRILDKFIIGKCAMLVATTEGFIKEYYKRWFARDSSYLIIENKLERKIPLAPTSPLEEKSFVQKGILKIGYFGLLRSEWSWSVLKELARKQGDNVEIIIAGLPILKSNLEKEALKYSNIKYLGKYKSPNDLSKLYSQVDLVWACYPDPDVAKGDWKKAQMICRSNRFYESCNFQKPIISLEGSADEMVINKYGIGRVIKEEEIEQISSILSGITTDEVEMWVTNMRKLPEWVYIFTDENIKLKNSIVNVLNNKNHQKVTDETNYTRS